MLRIGLAALFTVPDLPLPKSFEKKLFPHIFVKIRSVMLGFENPGVFPQDLLGSISRNGGKCRVYRENGPLPVGYRHPPPGNLKNPGHHVKALICPKSSGNIPEKESSSGIFQETPAHPVFSNILISMPGKIKGLDLRIFQPGENFQNPPPESLGRKEIGHHGRLLQFFKPRQNPLLVVERSADLSGGGEKKNSFPTSLAERRGNRTGSKKGIHFPGHIVANRPSTKYDDP